MHLEDLRPISLFDGLDDTQLWELLAAGEEIVLVPGVELFREGDHADFWWVLVDGAIELVRHVGAEDVVVGRMANPGQWAGGFRAWDEQGVYLATARGVEPGRMFRLPSATLRALLDEWFPFGVHIVNGIFGTARRIEATARQRDSLVTLGRLAAGLAHELNNPAAAAVRAVAAMETNSASLLTSLGDLAQERITAEQFAGLDLLRRELGERPVVLDALALADAEDALDRWMEDRGLEQGWEIAPPLAAASADTEWCERVDALLGPALAAGLAWVSATTSLSSTLGEIHESTRRVSELVSAVRSYSQMDRGSRQPTQVTEGIDSTLVMLGHKVPDGVEVIRAYDPDLPVVDAFPGELNQVWTNLVDNALDAMGESGVLRVVTRRDGDRVVVEVCDTGPGLSKEVATRAFEAFFTTKDVGQGTGLGLDIARRIVVERHGGEIVIHPEPGHTVFEVRIPISHAD
ncbi:MAG: ATP-binding protein [Nocardioides sp.]|uniref:sensor histidine kinase n=1 Tax=Nocardioides sp. TaxID=35761 RepID=UPI0032653B35